MKTFKERIVEFLEYLRTNLKRLIKANGIVLETVRQTF